MKSMQLKHIIFFMPLIFSLPVFASSMKDAVLATKKYSEPEESISSGPEDSGIMNLKILSYDGKNKTTIYANGKMQAALDIIYELEQGYILKSAVLKKYNTEESLEGWEVTEVENQYLHNVYSTKKGLLAISQNTKKLYLSTDSPSSVQVCVEVTATKSGVESVKSTCIPGGSDDNVDVDAIPPKYLTKNNFELSSWAEASPINKYVAGSTGTWSNEIREQVIRRKENTPEISSIESDYLLEGGTSPLYISRALVSKYMINVAYSGLSHIMTWVAHPDKISNIDFIENVGLNESWGYTLRREIPYHFKDDPMYVTSLVTYILRDDKFLYNGVYNNYALCGERVGYNAQGVQVKDCQVIGDISQSAPVYGYSPSDIERWKTERLKGNLNVVDWYGTKSILTLGARYINDVYSEIVIE